MDAALYTLVGVIVGAVASFGGMYLQQRQQDRRERLKMAVDLGLQSFKHDIEFARAKGGALVAPLAGYVILQAQMLDAIAAGDVEVAPLV